MSELEAYLRLGLWHITDLNGYDHILFIISLCAVYQLNDWKKILVLVTAFTLGHSITLALATLDILRIDSQLVELLIPITILLTATYNITTKGVLTPNTQNLRYVLATIFGLIHGLGFSNFLRSMLSKKQSIFEPLLAFNIGLEIGQLLIVLVFFVLSFIVITVLKIAHRFWFLAVHAVVITFTLHILVKLLSTS